MLPLARELERAIREMESAEGVAYITSKGKHVIVRGKNRIKRITTPDPSYASSLVIGWGIILAQRGNLPSASEEEMKEKLAELGREKGAQ
jgi:hypothetical protein